MTAQTQAAVDWWNAMARDLGLAPIVKLTKTRERHLQARIQEPEWDREKIEALVRSSSFLLGNNDRGWKVNFDFLINPNSYVKILEGRYNNGRRHQGIQAPAGKYEGLAI